MNINKMESQAHVQDFIYIILKRFKEYVCKRKAEMEKQGDDGYEYYMNNANVCSDKAVYIPANFNLA